MKNYIKTKSYLKKSAKSVWKFSPEWLKLLLIWIFSKKFLVGVRVVVLDSQNRILLLRHVFRNQDEWELPGGWLDGNESPEDAAYREIKEETGLEIEVRSCIDANKSPGNPHIGLGFLCYYLGNLDKDQLNLSFEVLEAKFFEGTALPENLRQDQREFIKKAYLVATSSLGRHSEPYSTLPPYSAPQSQN